MDKGLQIPANLSFAKLGLERERATKRLLYNSAVLTRLAAANQVDGQTTVFDQEDFVAWLIAEWYLAHRARGGNRDKIAEQILAEVAAV